MSECFYGFFEDTPLGRIVIDDQDALGHYVNSLLFTVTRYSTKPALKYADIHRQRRRKYAGLAMKLGEDGKKPLYTVFDFGSLTIKTQAVP